MDSENNEMKILNLKMNNDFLKKVKINKSYKYLFIINLIFIFIVIIFLYKILFFLKNNVEKNEKKIDKFKLLKLVTNNNEIFYKGLENCLIKDPDSQYCIYHLIYPKKVIGKNRILIGGEKRDGSYVLLDDFDNIKVAYSFGISTNIQFDKNLADKDIDIYMYDHTIDSLPYNNSKFHWKKIGLAGKGEQNEQLKTIEELIIENGHSSEKNMILKIDVEHYEWNSLLTLKDDILNKFKYIAVEYHFEDESKINETELYYNVIKKLHKSHQVFYYRCSGSRSRIVTFGNNRICKILEVSYVIKKENLFSKDETIYPNFEFDWLEHENDGKAEINLNLFKLFDN